jgi:hypothetical protein
MEKRDRTAELDSGSKLGIVEVTHTILYLLLVRVIWGDVRGIGGSIESGIQVPGLPLLSADSLLLFVSFSTSFKIP